MTVTFPTPFSGDDTYQAITNRQYGATYASVLADTITYIVSKTPTSFVTASPKGSENAIYVRWIAIGY